MEGKKERRNIKVSAVGSWKSVGKGKVLGFDGEDHISYETWSEQIAEHVKVGATLDAEVEFTVTESQGQTYHHNKVFQLYVDGKPVRTEQSKGNWRPQEDSPEKRKSIEDQKRSDLISQLSIADKITQENILVVKLCKWLELLGETTQKVDKAQPTPAGQQAQASGNGFSNAGEFLSKCLVELKLSKTQVLKQLAVADITDIKDFKAAYEMLAGGRQSPDK